MSVPQHCELMLEPEVQKETRLSSTTLWRMERKGLFPKRIKISAKRVAWDAAEVRSYIERRKAERNGPAEAA